MPFLQFYQEFSDTGGDLRTTMRDKNAIFYNFIKSSAILGATSVQLYATKIDNDSLR